MSQLPQAQSLRVLGDQSELTFHAAVEVSARNIYPPTVLTQPPFHPSHANAVFALQETKDST